MRSQPTLNQTGRVEGGILAQQDVREFVVEDGRVFVAAEIAVGLAPVADGFGDAGDQLAHAGFALGRADRAVQILRGHDVGGRHRPVFGDLDVFLLEDHVALGIGDLGKTEFPFDLVVGGDAGLGEEAAELQAGGLLLCWGSAGPPDSGLFVFSVTSGISLSYIRFFRTEIDLGRA